MTDFALVLRKTTILPGLLVFAVLLSSIFIYNIIARNHTISEKRQDFESYLADSRFDKAKESLAEYLRIANDTDNPQIHDLLNTAFNRLSNTKPYDKQLLSDFFSYFSSETGSFVRERFDREFNSAYKNKNFVNLKLLIDSAEKTNHTDISLYKNVLRYAEGIILKNLNDTDIEDCLSTMEKYRQLSLNEENAELLSKDALDFFLTSARIHISQCSFQKAGAILESINKYYPQNKDYLKVSSAYNEAENSLVLFKGQVEHIFFHPLIAYPERAFDKDSMSKGYNDWFVTVSEFTKILDCLYKNGFMLADIKDIYSLEGNGSKKSLVKKKLYLPKNKKPLIISIDDLNYYDYMKENGNVYKLVLDKDGKTAAYSVDPKGKPLISRDNEIVPILDRFVESHPDFSYHGIKGNLALTGFNGILGYQLKNKGTAGYITELNTVKTIVRKLKDTGWSFSSHGYGHLDAAKVSYEALIKDTLRWRSEIEPLVGKTDIYTFPYGSAVFEGNPKFNMLLENGFSLLFAVGGSPFIITGNNYMLMDRREIDGMAFHYQRKRLKDLFDVDKVIDGVRPQGYYFQ